MATERRRGSDLQEGSGEIWIETLEDSFSSDWPLRGIPVMTQSFARTSAGSDGRGFITLSKQCNQNFQVKSPRCL